MASSATGTGNNTAADASPLHNGGSFPGTYAAGRPGGDAAFDLSTGRVTIPFDAAYGADIDNSAAGWSVGMWFNRNEIDLDNSNATFLGQDNGAFLRPKWFIRWFAGTASFQLHLNDFNGEGTGNGLNLFSSPVPYPNADDWHQLTVVVDNVQSDVSFYEDALLVGTAALPNYVLRTNAPLVFGFAEPGFHYEGLLNDVAIYDRALSPADVEALVQSGSVPEPGSLVLVATGVFGVGMMVRRRTRGTTPFTVASSLVLIGSGLALLRLLHRKRTRAHSEEAV